MKKLFAILIVALLATSMSFAQPGVYNNGQSWQSNAETGEFQAEIMCIPAFSMPLTGGLLGNFFNSVGTHSIPSPVPTCVTNMTGPNKGAETAYTVVSVLNGKYTTTINFDGTTDLTAGSPIISSAPGFDASGGGNEISTIILTGSTVVSGGNASGQIDCTIPTVTTFTPTTIGILAGNAYEGPVYWTVVTTMTVAI